jgi:hypothetical protein
MFIFLKRPPNTAYSPTLFAVLRRLAGGGGENVSDWSMERHPPEAAALPGSVVVAAVVFFDFKYASALV